MLALTATVLLLQSVPQPLAVPLRPQLAPPLRMPGPTDPLRALRAGLETLYGGDFEAAAGYFATLAAREPTDPAPVVFQAGSYIWWASAKDSADFELQRIDSLLGVAMARARAMPAPSGDFWLATALGYRARQREEHGHGYSAAKDAKAMRDIYRRLLAADSSCIDCYLGLGVYDNSVKNRWNPAPHLPVYWSEQSWDEMYQAFTEYTVDSQVLTGPGARLTTSRQ